MATSSGYQASWFMIDTQPGEASPMDLPDRAGRRFCEFRYRSTRCEEPSEFEVPVLDEIMVPPGADGNHQLGIVLAMPQNFCRRRNRITGLTECAHTRRLTILGMDNFEMFLVDLINRHRRRLLLTKSSICPPAQMELNMIAIRLQRKVKIIFHA